MILLVHLLREVLRKNAIKSPVVKKKTKETYENGLSEDDRAKIKEFMFTSKNMELNSSQERFLQSTINLGFPKAGTFDVFLINPSSPGKPHIRVVGYHRRWLTKLSHTNTIEVAESARHARQTNTEMPRDADSLPINLGKYPDRYDWA